MYVRNTTPTVDPQALAAIDDGVERADRDGSLAAPHIVHALTKAGYRIHRDTPQPEPLPELQREVLVRIAAGMSNPEIAADLVLSEEAIKSRIRKLLVLLNVRDRHTAVVAAIVQGHLHAGDPALRRYRGHRATLPALDSGAR